MRELIGKKVTAVSVSDDGEHYLQFDTDQGLFVYEAEGDCCSETWFAEVHDVDALLAEVVTEIRDVEKGEGDDGAPVFRTRFSALELGGEEDTKRDPAK